MFTGLNDKAVQEDLWSRGIADYAHKSGTYSLEYVVWVVKRIYLNRHVDAKQLQQGFGYFILAVAIFVLVKQ